MKKPHATDWPSDAPSPAQFKELFAQVASKRVTNDRLQAFLRGEVSEMPTNELPVWNTWKTIDLRKFYMGQQAKITRMTMLRHPLAEKDYKVSELANELLTSDYEYWHEISQYYIDQLELVVVSAYDLGLPRGVTRKDIYDRAIELGLGLCPCVVGPQLRLQYENQKHKDQSGGEKLLIAMEPISDSLGRLSAFSVDHIEASDERWLNAHNDVPGNLWDNETFWVFLKSNE